MTTSSATITFGNPAPIAGQTTTGPIGATSFKDQLFCVYGGTGGQNIYVTSSTDALNWVPAYAIPNQTCANAGSLTVFNNCLYMAYIDSNGNGQVWITFSADGIKWTAKYLSDQTTSGAMCLTVFNDTLYLTYRDSSGSAIYVTSSADGINWSGAYQIPKQGCQGDASLVAMKDKLYLVYMDDSSTQLWCTYSSDGVNWIPQPIKGQSVEGPICLSAIGEMLYLVYQGTGTDTMFVTTSQDGISWTPGTGIKGQGVRNAAAMTLFNGHLSLIYEDSSLDSNGLWITSTK